MLRAGRVLGALTLLSGLLSLPVVLATDPASAVEPPNAGVLDPTFGGDGTVEVSGRSPISSGMVVLPDSSFLAVVGGANDVIDVIKVSADGSLDPAFGSGGRVSTGLRERPVGKPDVGHGIALDAQGRIYVSGIVAAPNSGGPHDAPGLVRLSPTGVVERSAAYPYLPNGRWGPVSTSKPGQPVGVVVRGSDVYLFAVLGAAGSADVGALRLDSDLGFIKAWTMGVKDASPAADVAIHADRVLVAAKRARETTIARLKPDLTYDTFGTSGRVAGATTVNTPSLDVDASTSKVLLATDTSGTSARVRVQRFNANGTTDATFGTQTIAPPAGSSTTTYGHVDADGGRAVVGALAGSGTTHRAMALRLRTVGSTTSIDPSFENGGDGVVVLEPATIKERMIVDHAPGLGVYLATTTGGQAVFHRLGNGRIGAVSTSITPAVAEGSDAGRRLTDAADLGGAVMFSDANGATAAGYQAAPYRLNPYRLNPYRLNPFRLNPYRLNPFRLNPFRLNPFRLNPFRLNSTLSELSVGEFELVNPPGWSERFEGSRWEGRPPLTVTWGELLNAQLAPGEHDPLEGLTLADVRLENTPLGDVSVAALVLMGVPLSLLPNAGCTTGANQAPSCPPGDPATTTLLDLELSGYDTSAYLAAPLDLAPPTDFSGSPLDNARLVDVDLYMTVLGGLEIARLPNAATFVRTDTCSAGNGCLTLNDAQELGAQDPAQSGLQPTASLGALIRTVISGQLLVDPTTGEGPTTVTLAQVLPGFAPAGELPLDELPRDAILDQARLRGDRLYSVTTSFTIDCAAGGRNGVLVSQLPSPRSRYVPGTSSVRVQKATGTTTTAVPDPGADGYPLPATVCSGTETDVQTVALTARYEPGEVLGTFDASSRVQLAPGVAKTSPPVAVHVIDGPEPGDDAVGTATTLEDGVIVAGHLSYRGDEDLFRYTMPADLPLGSRITVTLTHLPADYDLAVAGGAPAGITTPYRLNPFRLNPFRLNPFRLNALDDTTNEPGADSSTLAPEPSSDLPITTTVAAAGTVRGSSINRGTAPESVTTVVRAGDPGKTLTYGIGGYNNAYSEQPYLVHLTVRPAPPLPACVAGVNRSVASPGELPAGEIAADRETLILVAPSRMPGLDMGLINTVAARNDVKGVVLPVDGSAAVRAAYAYADQNPCSVEAWNAVVGEITNVVAAKIGDNAELRHLVIVGPDHVIPQARLIDPTDLGNELEHVWETIFESGRLDTISAAFGGGYFFSDNPYGSFAPFDFLHGDQLHLPNVAVGRVLETASDANAAFQAFITNNGVLNPTKAFTAGYDFLTDGAVEIDRHVRGRVGDSNATLRTDNWNGTDAVNGYNTTTGGFTSINGHYDQTHMLPASGLSDTITTSDPRFAASLAGSVIFTSGCHAGLSIPDQVSANSVLTKDWAQHAAERGALFVGNSGFGYGDSDTVAVSERLFAFGAEFLASGDVTAGQAWLFAQHKYFAGQKPLGAYDAKVMEMVNLSGLPMWRIGPDGGVGAPAYGPEVSAADSEAEFDVDPSHTTEQRSDGTVITASAPGTTNGVQASHFRPLSWNLYRDLGDGAPVKSVVLEEYTSVDGTPVDPSRFVPVLDDSDSTYAPTLDEVAFPVQLTGKTGYFAPDGYHEQAVVSAVQWYTDEQTPRGQAIPRRVTHAKVRVIRNDSPDSTPPLLESTTGYVIPGAAPHGVINASVVDGAVEGFVLYRTDADADGQPWRRADFADLGGDQFGAALTGLPSGATFVKEYILQFCDAAGNCLWSSDKDTGFVGLPFPSGGPGPAQLVASRPPDAAGVYTGPAPDITLVGAVSGKHYSVRINGGPLQPYSGVIDIPDTDGVYTVTAIANDGSPPFGIAVIIDRTGPVITPEISTPPNANGWHNQPVTIRYRCADAGAGVETCPPDVTISSDTNGQDVVVTAVDRAGNVSTNTVRVQLDRTGPLVVATIYTLPEEQPATPNYAGWHNRPVRVAYVCDDQGGSGVAVCPDPVTVDTEGTHTLVATASDVAGNVVETSTVVRLDLTNPTATITEPFLGVLAATTSLTGTAGDLAPPGSGIAGTDPGQPPGVEVTFTPVAGGEATTLRASVSCNATRSSCTWAVDPSLVGVYSVTATSRDFSDRTGATSVPLVITLL